MVIASSGRPGGSVTTGQRDGAHRQGPTLRATLRDAPLTPPTTPATD